MEFIGIAILVGSMVIASSLQRIKIRVYFENYSNNLRHQIDLNINKKGE